MATHTTDPSGPGLTANWQHPSVLSLRERAKARIGGIMPSGTTVLSFCLAALVVLVVPGPSVAYVVACTLRHGRTAGLASVVGLELGALVHVVAAAAGLGAVLASSPDMFRLIRYAGAAYLLLMGARELRPPNDNPPKHRAAPSTRLRMIRDGLLVDLLNPKTVLFFLAFLPQFVRPAVGSGPTQILVLGTCFVVLATACDATYATIAATVAPRLHHSPRARRRIRHTTGGVYLTLAGIAVLS
ncbi:LysE family translocator [Kribbella speibonae]|uniref:LysE family translocator n=2 Tax=Kribbella speibonae TaxID=1572660 RepID=A0ABY2A4H2_9ACTN|nr:LysE family translocator [Kribbella speibonae]